MRTKNRENLQYVGQMALGASKPVKMREQSTENRFRFQAAKQRTISNAPVRNIDKNLINQIRNQKVPQHQNFPNQKQKIVKEEKSKNLIPSAKSPSLATQNNQINNATQSSYPHQRTDNYYQSSIQIRYNQSQQNFYKKSNQFEEKEKQNKLEFERKQEKSDPKIKNDALNENQNKLNEKIKLKQAFSKEETNIPLQASSFQKTQLYQTRSEGVNNNSQIKSTNEQAKQSIKEQEKSKDISSQSRFVEISQKNTEDRRGSLTSAGKMASNTQQSNSLQNNQQLEQTNGIRPTNSATKQYQAGTSTTVNINNQNGGRRQQNLLEMKNQIGENKENQKPDKQIKREERKSSDEESQSDEEQEEEKDEKQKKIEALISQKNQKQIDKNPNQGLVGLANIGNTCFMNSILQCLLHTPALAQYFCTDQYNNELNKKAKMKGELAKNYGEFVKSCKSSRNNSTVTPSQIKFLIGKYAPQFMGYAQQDSQELLRFLLDGLHEDLNRVKSKPTYRELPSDARQIGKAQLAQM